MPGSLLVDLQTLLISISLITPRALVCLMILPGFSLRTLTGMARNGVAIAIVLPAVLPTFLYVQQTPPDFFMALMLVFKEAGIGCMLGVLMSIPIWATQSIGSILDTQRSPIQIQSNNASIDQDASATGALLLQAIVLVMIQAGLFVVLARILIESYGTWPAFSLLPPFEPGHFDVLIKRFGDLFWHIVVYGGPVLIPLLLIDFGFAILGVFASNLQISFASSPVKSLTGLFILLVYWPTFSHHAAGDFARMLDLAATLLQASPR
ncbi:EscT/YscT/HrcT family type III secretion system export apparatus protein [Noviherbaspirillum cavernae]|uniref:EscT/YscT/HrcT family type III secretion system export apparatus protein n=1 Tax=Noviherbaspirillum cavernae TaxID=2320862 RepID=A0A418WW13_9BURK|nr:type III secretion system export apparatus subunit SctT [Noviherbaspirillum cavernae]RJF96896.1 EscT/YscT/HrcT family type III secretion system export apparatus protein [Noviherbaspirillum cavernae]